MNKGYRILKVSNVFILSLITIITIEAFIILKQSNDIKTLKSSLTHTFPGEKIDYFGLIGTDKKQKDEKILANNKISIIYIFEQPCTPCNKNITIWKKIAGVLKNKIKVYGVILDEISEIIKFSKSFSLNFELYSPIDINKFKKKFRITSESSQTILLRKNNVIYCKTGELEANDYFDIVRIIKGGLK